MRPISERGSASDGSVVCGFYLLLCLGPMEKGRKKAVGKSWARELGLNFHSMFWNLNLV